MMVAAAAAGLVLAGCRVEQVEEAQPPDVQVEPGQLPQYETEPGQVQVRPDTEQVTVPDVDVQRPAEPGQPQQPAPQPQPQPQR